MRAPRPSSPFPVRAGLIRAVLAGLIAVLAGCSSGGGSPAASAPSGTGVAATGAAATTTAPAAAQAGCDTDPWRSAPVSVSHAVPVPPVPVVTAISAATHTECGFDRLVLSLSGKMPSYTIRYVSRVIADPSGRVVRLPGSTYLVITLQPGQAHRDSGARTLPGGVAAPGFPRLVSYALAGDAEGVVTVAVGLSGTARIRVGELPGRLYVDFRT
jgi:hypothetical protein